MVSFFQEVNKRYFYWSEIKQRPNLQFENPEKAEKTIKAHRFLAAKRLGFENHNSSYNLTSFIQEDVRNSDLKLIGGLYKNSITPQEQQQFRLLEI